MFLNRRCARSPGGAVRVVQAASVDAGLERSTEELAKPQNCDQFVGYRLALVFIVGRNRSAVCAIAERTGKARLDVAYRHGRVGDRNLDVVDGDLGQNALEARPATGDAISVHAQVGDAKDPRGTASDRRQDRHAKNVTWLPLVIPWYTFGAGVVEPAAVTISMPVPPPFETVPTHA